MSCPQHHSASEKSKKWSFWSAALLVVLPKCPYCFVAYSSAISICGLPNKTSYHWEHYFIGFLLVVIVVSLLKRYHGLQTLLALTLVVVGGLLIWLSIDQGLSNGYVWGSVLVLISTVINRKIFSRPNWFRTY